MREGDHQRYPQQPGSLQAVLEDIEKQQRRRDLLPGRHRRLRPEPARVHRPGDEVQGRPAGQPRPGGDVRPGRLQPARRAGHLLDARPAGNAAATNRAAKRAALGVPGRTAAHVHSENGFLFVHGSARNPLNEYVFPEDIYNQRKMDRIFALVERYCFQGHTHVPGVFTESLPEDLTSSTPRRDRLRLQARRPQDAVQRRLGRPAARRRSGGPATSCSTARRSASAASSTTSTRPSRRSTTSPTWTTSSATACATAANRLKYFVFRRPIFSRHDLKPLPIR